MKQTELKAKCPMCKKTNRQIVKEVVASNHTLPARVVVTCAGCGQVHYIVNE